MRYNDCIKIVVAACVGLALSYRLTTDVSADMILNLVGGSADFEMSDFYNRVAARGGAEGHLDPHIAVVNIDTVADRAGIAQIIHRIAGCSPAVIGVDVIFDGEKDRYADSMLCDAVARHSRLLVLAKDAGFSSDGSESTMLPEAEQFIPETEELTFGAVNLVNRQRHGIVRSWMASFDGEEGVPLPSFASAVAEKAGAAPLAGDRERMLIFPADGYYCLEPSEIERDADLLRGRVVLVGTLSDPADLHATPIETDYPGVLLQAYIISNIMDRRSVSVLSGWVELLAAIALSLLTAWLYARTAPGDWQNIALRVATLMFVALGIWAGCVLYVYFSLYLDVVRMVLPVALTQLVLDVATAFSRPARKMWAMARGRLSRRKATAAGLMLFMALPSAMADEYRIYRLDGAVTDAVSGKVYVNGDTVGADTRFDMSRCAALLLVDMKMRCVYKVGTADTGKSVALIVSGALAARKWVTARMVEEISRNGAASSKRNLSNLGASHRDDRERMNLVTEYAYLTVCGALAGGDAGMASGCVTLSPREDADGCTGWEVNNPGDDDVFVAVIAVPAGALPRVLTALPDGAAPMLPAGEVLTLAHEMWLPSEGDRFLLVVACEPFDCGDLAMFLSDGEEPLTTADFPEPPRVSVAVWRP